MWTWIYYTVVTFGALACCSTVAIITIMGGEDVIKEKEEEEEEEARAEAAIDIESGEALTYRKKSKPISRDSIDTNILNF
tara:strand:- start:244 stop:483 length:240 start_codon:yes stop_codon:yes gene_type:complete